MEVEFKNEKGEVVGNIKLEPKTFKSGSSGFYFRERVVLGGEDYHVQIIISKK